MPLDSEEMEEQRRSHMFQLSQIIRTLDDYKSIKGSVIATEKLVKDIDHWRNH